MRYEYKEVNESVDIKLIDLLNESGKDGWKLVNVQIIDGYFPSALLERVIRDETNLTN